MIPTKFTIKGVSPDKRQFSVIPEGSTEVIRGYCLGHDTIETGVIRVKIKGHTPTTGRTFFCDGQSLDAR